MRIVVLSDTHMPRSAEDLPAVVYEEIGKCDMIIHAGDFVEKELYDKLKSLRQTVAVIGNMDSVKFRGILNSKEVIEIGKLKIGVIHGYGAPSDLLDTVRKEFSKVDVIVFGHSHKPMVLEKNGVLYINPGSPTDAVYAPYNSYGILEIIDDKITGTIERI